MTSKDSHHSDSLASNELPPVGAVDENGWPLGYFDRVAGLMPDLERAPQGEFERRMPLE